MLKKLFFILLDSATLALIILAETHPNKYVSNLLIVARIWLAMGTALIWLVILSFATDAADKNLITVATAVVNPDKRWAHRLIRRIGQMQDGAVIVASAICGQWFIFLFYLCAVFNGLILKDFASRYLSRIPVSHTIRTTIVIDAQ